MKNLENPKVLTEVAERYEPVTLATQKIAEGQMNLIMASYVTTGLAIMAVLLAILVVVKSRKK